MYFSTNVPWLWKKDVNLFTFLTTNTIFTVEVVSTSIGNVTGEIPQDRAGSYVASGVSDPNNSGVSDPNNCSCATKLVTSELRLPHTLWTSHHTRPPKFPNTDTNIAFNLDSYLLLSLRHYKLATFPRPFTDFLRSYRQLPYRDGSLCSLLPTFPCRNNLELCCLRWQSLAGLQAVRGVSKRR
jgi:hypothetical protein